MNLDMKNINIRVVVGLGSLFTESLLYKSYGEVTGIDSCVQFIATHGIDVVGVVCIGFDSKLHSFSIKYLCVESGYEGTELLGYMLNMVVSSYGQKLYCEINRTEDAENCRYKHKALVYAGFELKLTGVSIRECGYDCTNVDCGKYGCGCVCYTDLYLRVPKNTGMYTIKISEEDLSLWMMYEKGKFVASAYVSTCLNTGVCLSFKERSAGYSEASVKCLYYSIMGMLQCDVVVESPSYLGHICLPAGYSKVVKGVRRYIAGINCDGNKPCLRRNDCTCSVDRYYYSRDVVCKLR